MRCTGSLLLSVLLLLTAACGKSEEKAQPAAPAKPQAVQPAPQQPHEAELKNLSRQFQGLQRRISRLQAELDQLPPAAKARMNRPMASLLQHQNAVAQKLSDLGQAPDEKAWAGLLPRARTALQGLQQSYAQTLKAAAPYLNREKEAYVKKTGAQLAGLQRRLQALQARIKTSPPAHRHRLGQEAETVHQKLTSAASKLATLKAAGPLAWQELRPGVAGAVKDLGAAYTKLAAQVRKAGSLPKKKKTHQGGAAA
jgi:chromosome segregation ATPase